MPKERCCMSGLVCPMKLQACLYKKLKRFYMQEAESAICQETVHQRVVRLMGNRFEISVVSDDEQWASNRIDDAIHEISRIEKLLTTFNDSSQVNLINQFAGIRP